MTGSLQRKKGKFYAVLNLKDKYGHRKQKWVPLGLTVEGNKTEASLKLQQILYENRGKEICSGDRNMTFAAFMRFWLESVCKRTVEITTYEGYQLNLGHIVPYFEKRGIRLKKLTSLDLQEYFDRKYEDGKMKGEGGLSACYLKKQYFNMKKALDYAVREGYIFKSPLDNVILPRMPQYIPEYYNAAEMKALMRAAKGSIIETAVILACYYGLRRGETLGLRWQDVDFFSKEIRIRNSRTRVATDIVKAPKTSSSIRTLPMMDEVEKHLLEIRERQAAEKKAFGKGYAANDYVIRNADGTPIGTNSVDHAFKRIIGKAGLKIIRFHDLRHSAASLMIRTGMALKNAQTWLGHSDIGVTANIYVHLDAESKRKDAVKINDALKDEEADKHE